MSKNSKKRERELKIAKRKAMKKAHMAQQDNYRLKKHNKKKKRHTQSHPEGPCGNIGCKRCNPAKLHKKEISMRAGAKDSKILSKLKGKEKYLERMKRNKK